MRRFLFLLVLAGVACGGDATAPQVVSVAGAWTLQSINGTTLPFVVAQTGANKVEVVSDVITVVATGSFTQTTTYRTTDNGHVTTESFADAGSYTVNGNADTFHFTSDGSTGTAVFDASTLTVASSGTSYIYKR